MSPKKRSKSSLFVPISPHSRTNSCDLLIKIAVVNKCEEDEDDEQEQQQQQHSQDSAFENDFDSNSAEIDNKQIIENLSNILLDGHEDENCCETYMNLEIQNATIDIDEEETIDYSNKSVPVLVKYYEDRKDEVDTHVKEIVETKSDITKTEQKLNNTIELLNTTLPPKQIGLIAELAEVNMEYDWKDISAIGTASEFEESFLVPGCILSLSDNELRSRLQKVGETPGPISDTTRKLYQKYLARLEKNNNRPLKVSIKLNLSWYV